MARNRSSLSFSRKLTLSEQMLPGDTARLHVTQTLVEMDPCEQMVNKHGAVDGGSPMSPVDFKKWQCPLSLILEFPCHFKIVPCPLSI